MYSKPPDRFKPTNQPKKSSISQQSKVELPEQSKQARKHSREVTERLFVLPGHSASVAINLLANYPLLQTTTPRASHTGREGREEGREEGRDHF